MSLPAVAVPVIAVMSVGHIAVAHSRHKWHHRGCHPKESGTVFVLEPPGQFAHAISQGRVDPRNHAPDDIQQRLFGFQDNGLRKMFKIVFL